MNRENRRKHRESGRRKKHFHDKIASCRLQERLFQALIREIHPPQRGYDFDLERSRELRGLR